MTILTRRLRRETLETLSVDRMSRGRPIILELEPPNLIHFRWKGTRRRWTASIARLMQWTIQEAVEQARRERKRGK
ncbi:MAG: hypothetical protein ACE5JO_08160 [Candidatus Binatia bacterium]